MRHSFPRPGLKRFWRSWTIKVLFMSSLNLGDLALLIDDAKCYELVRWHRWPEGIRCPHCDPDDITLARRACTN